MNNNAKPNEMLISELLTQINKAQEFSAIRECLHRLRAAEASLEKEESLKLYSRVFRTAMEMTDADFNEAERHFLDFLIPICLDSHLADSEESGIAFAMHQLREVVSEWINRFPNDLRAVIRDRLLSSLSADMRAGKIIPSLSLISGIGFRNDEVVGALWEVASHGGKIGERALGTIISLGTTPADREKIARIINGMLANSILNRPVRLFVWQIAGPRYTDILFKVLEAAASSNDDRHEKLLTLQAVAAAVDRCQSDDVIHDQVWSVLRSQYDIIKINGSFAYGCDTAQTVVDYFQWMVEGRIAGDNEISTYSAIERAATLVKPRQLDGYSLSRSETIVRHLKIHASKDTGITGQFATIQLESKEAAWDALLCIGGVDVSDIFEGAVLDETNAFASHGVASIVSSATDGFLSNRFCSAIESAEKGKDTQNEYFFRQSALITVAHANGSPEAFKAMTKFGYVHEGGVLLSVIDAIYDLAVERVKVGDTDVVSSVVQMTDKGRPSHHRAAGSSAFCRLLMAGMVESSYHQVVWEMVLDESLDDFARREAVEAIGLSNVNFDNDRIRVIRKLAMDGPSDLGWHAWATLIRRGWIDASDEALLFQRLNLIGSSQSAENRDAAVINSWQAFLIGLLYEKAGDRFESAVCQILRGARSEVFYQLIRPIQRHGRACSEVLDALAACAVSVNDRWHADTFLFQILGKCAPEKLIAIAKSMQWRDWMVEGRAALCDAIAEAGTANRNYSLDIASTLISFMRDAAFQVRRSAYRGLGRCQPEVLLQVCKSWSQATDLELVKRASEAVGWVPIEHLADHELEAFGLSWHEDADVREIASLAISARRDRTWANQYQEAVMAAATEGSISAEAYRRSRALIRMGDDQTIRGLQNLLIGETLVPRVWFWINRTVKDMEKDWKKRTSKWPHAWSHETGTLESLKGELRTNDGILHPAKVLLWRQQRFTQSERYSWGGIAEEIEGIRPFQIGHDQVELVLENRPVTRVSIFNTYWSSNDRTRITFHGDAPYPDDEPAQ